MFFLPICNWPLYILKQPRFLFYSFYIIYNRMPIFLFFLIAPLVRLFCFAAPAFAIRAFFAPRAAGKTLPPPRFSRFSFCYIFYLRLYFYYFLRLFLFLSVFLFVVFIYIANFVHPPRFHIFIICFFFAFLPFYTPIYFFV